MRVGIFGRGRLGSAVAGLVAAESDMELGWSLGKGEPPTSAVDVALDASVGAAVADHLFWARDAGVNIVVGATGWDRSLLAQYSDWPIAVLTAPNFSLAAAFMRRMALYLGRFAAIDPLADLAIIERHHRAKLDAPSGTAKLLAAALSEGCPRYSSSGGDSAAGASAQRRLQIASLRAGSEVGYHEMRLEAEHETIVIAHEAKSRDIFAQGAVQALRWIRGKRGLFSFDDFAAEILSPLFLPPEGENTI